MKNMIDKMTKHIDPSGNFPDEPEISTIDNLNYVKYIDQEIKKIKAMQGYNIIKSTLEKLSIKGENIQFNVAGDAIDCYYEDTNIINITDIFTRLKKIKEACIPTGTQDIDEYKRLNKIKNQILRIKDSRITASKNIALLLVGAPTYKHKMIKETIDLAKNIFELTNIKLK
jgi:hypothetical protein